MNELKYLMIHYSFTPNNMEVTKHDILHWHTSAPPHGRGWSRPGYSDLIKRSGELVNLWDYDEDKWVQSGEITNGAKGFNHVTRHICLAGGKDLQGNPIKNLWNQVINADMFATLWDYLTVFIDNHPDCKILGHNQVSNKDCPGFNVPEFLHLIGINQSNIFRQ